MKKKLTVGILFCIAVLILYGIVVGRKTIGNLLSGRVHFPEGYAGRVIEMKAGQNFRIFRRLQVEGESENHDDQTVFIVRFRFRNLSPDVNKRLSVIPAPFLMGMMGFREKIWTINEKTNEFQGIYQWSSQKAAERYPKTFIFRLMTKRAAPGTISYEIMSNTDIVEYITKKRIN